MRRHLFYLTNSQLTAAVWRGGALHVEAKFANNDDGHEAFAEYLEQYGKMSALVLIDLIEEDFQRDSIPHLIGRTREALIQRRLGQLYRDTPYRHASLLGREKEGRKDDRMLFSALLNADLIRPWMDILLKQNVPIAGIYSVALLSALLFKKLGLETEPLLLVSHQSSGLRQSYFQGGEFRFSRLTQLASDEDSSIAEIANTEISKTRQFLASTRQLQRDQPIKIVVLADAEFAEALQVLSQDAPAISHHFVEPSQAYTQLGLKDTVGSNLCDYLFLTLLGASVPASHYALPEAKRFYLMWQTRTVLYVLSAATIAGGLFWAGSNALNIFETNSQMRLLDADTRMIEARYQTLMTSMPATVANAHDMKTAVDLEKLITQNAPSPLGALATISAALETQPQVKITQLRWEASATDPNAAGSADAGQPPPRATGETPPQIALIGVPNKPFDIVTIEGEIIPFADDFRSALEIVRQFVAELEKNKQIKVNITRQPLDVRPVAAIKGQVGNPDAESVARFDLKLVRKP